MEWTRNPLFRVFILILVLAMLWFMPTREFLKITFFLAIPAIIIAGYMLKRRRYSFTWVVSLVLLLGIGVFYIYQITLLPDRIAGRQIISTGSVLMAEGRFSEARQEYLKLEEIGREEKMKQKLAELEQEETAFEQLQLARQHLETGDIERAIAILEHIEPQTRAGREAGKLLQQLE